MLLSYVHAVAVVARRVVVSGQVQGVFFRDSCRAEAARRGVAGWVSNTAAGTVEAFFEGEPDAVQAMCDWCRHGSPQARVDAVEVTDADRTGASSFRVR